MPCPDVISEWMLLSGAAGDGKVGSGTVMSVVALASEAELSRSGGPFVLGVLVQQKRGLTP